MNKNVWDQLLNYESRGLVAREYIARHPQWKESRTKEIASEVCATLRQARSYFVSARDADAAIKPLLLYYGALGLARGLILFTGHKAREATLDPRHGLTPKGWANELATEGRSIKSLSISLDSCGTFHELVSAVSNKTLVRFNSSAVQWSCGHKPLAEGTHTLQFGDLIQRTPAVAAFARRWLQLPPCFLGVHSIVNANADAGSFTLKVTCSEAERDRMTAVFGSVPWTVVSSDATFVDVRFDAQNASPYTWSDTGTLGIGSAYLIEDFGSFQLCQIAAVFVIAYVLGGAVAKVVEIGWWRSLWFVQRTISGVRAPAETTPWKRITRRPKRMARCCLQGTPGLTRSRRASGIGCAGSSKS